MSDWGMSIDSNVSMTNGISLSALKVPINIPAHLEILKLPVKISPNDVRAIFGRYGVISRLILDYRFENESVFCFIDYSDEKCSETAIRTENGKEREGSNIVVQKCTYSKCAYSNGHGDVSRKRQRTNDLGSNGNSNGTSINEWGSQWNGGGERRNDNGRGRGGGRGGGCFKCGEEGHMSRECPKGGGGGRGGARTCFNCGEEGHMSRECPKGGSRGGRGGRSCFNCGEDGHMSRECSKPRTGRGRGGRGGGGRDGENSRDSSWANDSNGSAKTDWNGNVDNSTKGNSTKTTTNGSGDTDWGVPELILTLSKEEKSDGDILSDGGWD